MISLLNGERKAVWNEVWMGMNGSCDECLLKGKDGYEGWLGARKKVHWAKFSDETVRLLLGDTGEEFSSIRKRCIDVEDLGGER